MKGKQSSQEQMFAHVRLEELVPKDHILRKIDKWIDFSSVEKLTEGLYSHTGRPSIDPELLIRMMLIGYLFGIISERRLCQEVHLNLAYRWFCRMNLEDKVPDHSTFSKNRHGRFSRSEIFREMFYDIVKQAKAKGLIGGKHLTVDATTVEANAALDSMEKIVVELRPEEHLAKVEEENAIKEEDKDSDSKPPKEKISNKTHKSRTDPEARLFSKRFQRTKLAYSNNVLMDNRNRVILDVEVTEPNIHQEGQAAGDMVERMRFRLGMQPKTLGGDKAYSYGPAVHRLCEAGVDPHVSAVEGNAWNTKGIFSKKDFVYDRERDELICPAGKRLKKRVEHRHNRQTEYAASVKDCRICPLKAKCTRARYRTTHRHLDQDYIDYAASLRSTLAYKISQKCRKNIEHLFGEAKEQMGLRRAQRRGRNQVSEQCLMTAMVQNIKRIVKLFERPQPRCIQAIKVGIFCLIQALVGKINLIEVQNRFFRLKFCEIK